MKALTHRIWNPLVAACKVAAAGMLTLGPVRLWAAVEDKPTVTVVPQSVALTEGWQSRVLGISFGSLLDFERPDTSYCQLIINLGLEPPPGVDVCALGTATLTRLTTDTGDMHIPEAEPSPGRFRRGPTAGTLRAWVQLNAAPPPAATRIEECSGTIPVLIATGPVSRLKLDRISDWEGTTIAVQGYPDLRIRLQDIAEKEFTAVLPHDWLHQSAWGLEWLVQNPDGTLLQPNDTRYDWNPEIGLSTFSMRFRNPLPPDSTLLVDLPPPFQVLTVPFTLNGIALPLTSAPAVAAAQELTASESVLVEPVPRPAKEQPAAGSEPDASDF